MASEQEDLIDRLAQAVIDKIEQRDQTEYLVSQVALRVVEMQKRDAALHAKAAQAADAPTGNDNAATTNTEAEN